MGTHGSSSSNGVNGVNGHGNGINSADRVSSPPRLFVLSARTEKSLTSYLSSFDDYLDQVPESTEFVKDLSYTLGQRRTHHAYRVSAVADSIEELQKQLSAVKPSKAKDRLIAFVFTGQGAQ